MTGIKRLRELAEDYISNSWSEVGKTRGMLMLEIADQIERERACDADTIENVRLIVGGVIDDMERHVSGVEGAEDSPVARWARELRGALKSDASDWSEAQNPSCVDTAETADATSEAQKVTRDPAEDVSMSAYDLLPADERDAIAWVRDHGGLDYVKTEWRSRSNLKRTCEKLRSKVERQQRHIEFVQGKCRDRQGHIVELSKELAELRKVLSDYRDALGGMCERLGITDGTILPEMPDVICEALDRRLMPEGMEWLIEAWPKFEDDAPVKLGDMVLIDGDADMVEAVQIWIHGKPVICGDNGGWQLEKGERVRRPAVLAADGEPLEVGQTVYNVGSSEERVVDHIEYEGGGTPNVYYADGGWDYPDLITHQRPVLDADGVPIKKGDTVYWLEHTAPFTVVSPHETRDNDGQELKCGHTVEVMRDGHKPHMYVHPESLHHTKPEPPDSWKRIEEDVMVDAKDYCESRGISSEYPKHSGKAKCEDIVRRCRALAERERGE